MLVQLSLERCKLQTAEPPTDFHSQSKKIEMDNHTALYKDIFIIGSRLVRSLAPTKQRETSTLDLPGENLGNEILFVFDQKALPMRLPGYNVGIVGSTTTPVVIVNGAKHLMKP